MKMVRDIWKKFMALKNKKLNFSFFSLIFLLFLFLKHLKSISYEGKNFSNVE